MSWKFTDESSVTFQSSVSGPGEFGLRAEKIVYMHITYVFNFYEKIAGFLVHNKQQ